MAISTMLRLMLACAMLMTFSKFASAAVHANMPVEQVMGVLFDEPLCEDFILGSLQWVPAESKDNCNGRRCNYPQELCMENTARAFSDSGRLIQCKSVPSACINAVNKGTSGRRPSPAPGPGPTRAPRPSPRPAPRPSPQPAPGPSPSADACSGTPPRNKVCSRYVRKYYHANGKCVGYWDSGCGFANSYSSHTACINACVKTAPAPAPRPRPQPGPSTGGSSGGNKCQQKKDAGRNCSGWRRFYAFDNGRCVVFYYGGCDGNENRFSSRRDCLAECTRLG